MIKSLNSWVIIWVSTFCKAEGVSDGTYFIETVAHSDADRFNRTDPTKRFHVVEYGSEEHQRALRNGK